MCIILLMVVVLILYIYVYINLCYKCFPMSRKIPRDLTEASLSGAGLSIIAALAMMFLFGMVKQLLYL